MFSSWLFCQLLRRPELVHIQEKLGLMMLTRLTWLTGLLPITLELCALRLLMVLIQVKALLTSLSHFLLVSHIAVFCLCCTALHKFVSTWIYANFFVVEWNFIYFNLLTCDGSGPVVTTGSGVLLLFFLFYISGACDSRFIFFEFDLYVQL